MNRSEYVAAHYLQCSADACRQGRMACPTPQACEQWEPASKQDNTEFWFVCAVGIVGWIAAFMWSLS